MKSDKYGDSQVDIGLKFYNNHHAKSVTWALVMYGDSCLAEQRTCIESAGEASHTTLPPSSHVTMVKIAQTPFSANRKDTVAQVIYGTTYFTTPVGRAGASIILGHIAATVVNSSGPEWDMTLPSYGRLPESPIFDFPNRPGALNLSIPGHWYRRRTSKSMSLSIRQAMTRIIVLMSLPLHSPILSSSRGRAASLFAESYSGRTYRQRHVSRFSSSYSAPSSVLGRQCYFLFSSGRSKAPSGL